MGLPLRLPRGQLELRVGVVRRPTALGPEAAHLGLDKRLARALSRGRELERRGRPGPLAAATIQAPRGLETSAVALAG